MPYTRLLATTDFSPPSIEAIRASRALAAQDAQWTLLHVLPGGFHLPLVEDVSSSQWERTLKEDERATEGRLRAIARNLGLADASVLVARGSVGRSVAQAAQDTRADVIVTGARGHSRWERVLLGSKAKAILRAAPTDVLVARAPYVTGEGAWPGCMAVATDFQPPAIAAAQRALDLSRWTGSDLLLFHAVDPAIWGTSLMLPDEYGAGGALTAYVDLAQLTQSARASLRQLNAQRLGGEAREVVVEGEPVHAAAALVKQEHVGLLVAGTHGAGAFERAVLGSVAEGFVERVPCSVLVAR